MTLDKVLEIAKVMRVHNWDINYLEMDSLDVEGRNYMIYNDYKCEIMVKRNLSEDEKIKTVIHELIHLITRDSQCIADENMSEEMKRYYNRFYERETEHLAKVFYEVVMNRGE